MSPDPRQVDEEGRNGVPALFARAEPEDFWRGVITAEVAGLRDDIVTVRKDVGKIVTWVETQRDRDIAEAAVEAERRRAHDERLRVARAALAVAKTAVPRIVAALVALGLGAAFLGGH